MSKANFRGSLLRQVNFMFAKLWSPIVNLNVGTLSVFEVGHFNMRVQWKMVRCACMTGLMKRLSRRGFVAVQLIGIDGCLAG